MADTKLPVINLLAGPGTGKSTTAAGVFHELKSAGINAELVTEYAKDKVWDKHFSILDNQLYILAKQFQRLNRLIDQVDIVVTDSPLILSWYYNQGSMSQGQIGYHFDGLVKSLFEMFDNHNFFLVREKVYNPKGRMQTEKEAKNIDVVLKQMLDTRGIPYMEAPGNKDAVKLITRYAMVMLGKEERLRI